MVLENRFLVRNVAESRCVVIDIGHYHRDGGRAGHRLTPGRLINSNYDHGVLVLSLSIEASSR